MSTIAYFLNMLPEDGKQQLIKEMKDGTLIMCDSVEELLAAIRQVTEAKSKVGGFTPLPSNIV